MVLSSWQSICERSPGSFNEYRSAAPIEAADPQLSSRTSSTGPVNVTTVK